MISHLRMPGLDDFIGVRFPRFRAGVDFEDRQPRLMGCFATPARGLNYSLQNSRREP